MIEIRLDPLPLQLSVTRWCGTDRARRHARPCDHFRHRPCQQCAAEHHAPELHRDGCIPEQIGGQRQRGRVDLDTDAHDDGGMQVRVRQRPVQVCLDG